MKKDGLLLSVVIPAYNVEKTLEKALHSFDDISAHLIEANVVDDGSTDSTYGVAVEASRNNPAIRITRQKNGGHGAAINKGVELARGKYLRVLDGDDWLDNKELVQFLNKLQNEEADLVLTEHIEVFEKNRGRRQSSDYINLEHDKILALDKVRFKKYGPTLPNMTVKTELLQKAGMKLDNKCFYVDQELDFIVYIFAKTVVVYNLPVYNYLLGQDNQSMAKKGLCKNIASHEKVCLRLLEWMEKYCDALSDIQQQHLRENIVAPLLNLQYVIAIKYKRSRKDFLSFDGKLKKYVDYYNDPRVAGNIIRLHRIMRGWTVNFDSILSKLGGFRGAR